MKLALNLVVLGVMLSKAHGLTCYQGEKVKTCEWPKLYCFVSGELSGCAAKSLCDYIPGTTCCQEDLCNDAIILRADHNTDRGDAGHGAASHVGSNGLLFLLASSLFTLFL